MTRTRYCPSLDTNYTEWTIKKFRREMEFWSEETHMAGTHELYVTHKKVLDPIKAAFMELHPRAYQNWLREFRESFQ